MMRCQFPGKPKNGRMTTQMPRTISVWRFDIVAIIAEVVELCQIGCFMKNVTLSPFHIGDIVQFKSGHATARLSVPTRNRWFIGTFKSLSEVRNEPGTFTLRFEQKIFFTPATGSSLYDPADPGESLFEKAVLGAIAEDDQGFLIFDPQRATWSEASNEFLVIQYKTKNRHVGWVVFTKREIDLRTTHQITHPESDDHRSQAAA